MRFIDSVLFTNGTVVSYDDIVTVVRETSGNITGRVITWFTTNNTIKLDVSTQYHQKEITLNADAITDIHLVRSDTLFSGGDED